MIERQETEAQNSDFQPKPLTMWQNVVLTLKVLAGAAVLIGLLWLGSLKA